LERHQAAVGLVEFAGAYLSRPLAHRAILRDQVSSNFSNIWVDSEADYERIVKFLNGFLPRWCGASSSTPRDAAVEHFGIQDEISKRCARRSGSRARVDRHQSN